jgi:cell division protease FtsH
MAPQQAGPQEKKSGPRQQFPQSLLFWWLMIGGLMVWNLFSLWPRSHPDVEIPYSTFLAEVRADDVANVHIAGDSINGGFVKPFLWPKQEAKSSAKPELESKAADAAKASPAPSATPPISYTSFHTTFPAAIGDRELMPLLGLHRVVVNVSSTSTPWFIELLGSWLPLILLVGFFWWVGNRATRSQSGLFGLGRMKARRYTGEQQKITFNDVAGADQAKAELQEEVDFLRHPQKYHDIGARIPKGVLLIGAPGTGKTLMARAVAGEAGVPFFSLNASEFV